MCWRIKSKCQFNSSEENEQQHSSSMLHMEDTSFRLYDNLALVFTILRDVATESRLLSGKVEVITSKVLA